ncbi:MAG: hypothetical protein ABFD89_22775 [Bryobacteraceae bacterium]
MKITQVTRRSLLACTAITALPAVALSAVRGDEAKYVGGTLAAIPENTEGKLDLTGRETMRFTAKKASVQIEYRKIKSIEYGQKAGRRVGVALAVSPVALFSKKRKHYVTLAFTDDAGKDQGAVFEIGKDSVRNVLTVLETRSGKQVEFESEEAKKNLKR